MELAGRTSGADQGTAKPAFGLSGVGVNSDSIKQGFLCHNSGDRAV